MNESGGGGRTNDDRAGGGWPPAGGERKEAARRGEAKRGGCKKRGRQSGVRGTADPMPPRIWTAVTRSARLNPRLAAAIEGREQSVHLEHLMRFDWSEPLVPDVARVCSCAKSGTCEHVAAVAYVFADLVDDDPSLLLRWRGCGSTGAAVVIIEAPAPEPAPEAFTDVSDGPWQAGRLPAPRRLRPLPVGAVLKCLGPTELRIGASDLTDALQRAYVSFATSDSR